MPHSLRVLHQYVGKKVTRLLLFGVAAGVALFGIELGFAYTLQAFFSVLGVTPEGASFSLPGWIAQPSLATVTILLLTIGSARALLYWAQQYLPNAAMEEISFQQRTRTLRWAFQSRTLSGARMLHVFNELNNGSSYALVAAQNLAVSATSAILLTGALFFLSPSLSLIVFALLSLLAIPLRRMDRHVVESSNHVWTEWGRTYTTLLASIKNLLLMQIYGTQNQEEAKTLQNVRRYRDFMLKHHLIAGLKFALPQMFGVLTICLIAVSFKKLDTLSASSLISYFYVLIRLVQSLATCAQHTSGLLTYRVPFLELMRWWQDEYAGLHSETSVLPQPSTPFPSVNAPIGWHLDNVTFQYPGASGPTLCGMNLQVEAGSAIVIQGPSGAGKSTLLNLVLGQLEPSTGEIRVHVDGKQRSLQQARSSLLDSIGYVGPESFLVEGTVKSNLSYGLNRIASETEIQEALSLADCGFVNDFSLGLEHAVSEQGTGLSAGQKQRLSLARALLRKPKALILDEATSNLDTETESRLVSTLTQLKGQMTIIAVTHRKALLEMADQQLLLEEVR